MLFSLKKIKYKQEIDFMVILLLSKSLVHFCSEFVSKSFLSNTVKKIKS